MTHAIQELHRNDIDGPERPLSTADLVHQTDGTAANTTTEQPSSEQRAGLFSDAELADDRQRWQNIQADFVDDPKSAVGRADELVASLIKRLAEVFANERAKLEHEWDKGEDVSTEDLRQALRRYRSFFDRLLSV
jgi:hypothetical protein